MKTKRILAALLAMLMLVGPLASCASGDGDGETQAGAQTGAATEAETGLKDNLPDDLNYGNDEITIISRYKEGWTDSEISVDGLTGEPVNDAVYERNKAVEDRLGVKIVNIPDNDPSEFTVVSKVAMAVKGGTNDYDIMAAACYTTLTESLNGTFANLRGEDCEYLDFDQIWWSQGFHEAVEYQGAQYAILGSMVLSMYRFGFITVFNKELFTDASQPYLYEYVQDGTWTLDKQAALVPAFYRENGDGVRDTKDIYGFASSTFTNIDAYWSACKLDIIKKDGDGNLQLVLDMDRLHSAVDKIIGLFSGSDGGTYYLRPDSDDKIWGTLREMFASGNAAMASFRFMELENGTMRNMEQEYGVVPMPKFDENQDDYYTLLHDQFTVTAIPSTVTGERLSEMSAVLEALSSTSYKTVRPVYYEDTLRTKIAQDPTAAEMMDIITENVYIDAGILYVTSLSLYHQGLRTIVQSGTNNSSSFYKAKNAACKRYLKDLSGRLDKLVENNS